MHLATYSPEDNKLRLYPSCRLDAAIYARAKELGFGWAPKQELFVAGAWTPAREDFLLELAGEIDDEDTSLVDRAEDRADRFEDFSEQHEREAECAYETVSAIADSIPLGQPILIGHHSERRARKDKERMDAGMARAVKCWETSKYWADRAAGAIRHAKYKERPDVRARRIKGIEADKRKAERAKAEAEKFIKAWSKPDLTLAYARAVANYDHVSKSFTLAEYPREMPASQYEGPMSLWSALDDGIINAEQAAAIAIAAHEGTIAWRTRWISHYENRLIYERAMLEEQGGTVADRVNPENGGAVKCWCSPGYGKGWSYIKKVNKVSVTVEDNFGNGGRNFTRTITFDKLTSVMTKAQVDTARAEGRIHEALTGFFLDEPVETREEAKPRGHLEADAEAEKAKKFDDLSEVLRSGGVQTVVAPQLFPTPPDLVARVLHLAGIQPGQRILEPSAGTGAFLKAIVNRACGAECLGCLIAVEINPVLAAEIERVRNLTLYATESNYRVICGDFLQQTDLGTFHRIVMNPPFANAADIQHIRHALTMLKPGGRLVAICANGPRQRDQLMPEADEWYDLPAGSFEENGTSVNAAIVVFGKDRVHPAQRGKELT